LQLREAVHASAVQKVFLDANVSLGV